MDRFARRLKRLFRRGRYESRARANIRRSVAVTSALVVVASAIVGSEAGFFASHAEPWGRRGDDETLNAAMAAVDRQISRAPIDATPWLDLAWLEAQGPRGLGPEGNAALLRSYALAPYGPETTLWRLAFIFDHWRAVTPVVRARALDEMAVVYRRQGWDIEALSRTIEDPTGRMVAVLASRRLRATETLAQPRPNAARQE